LLRERLLSPLGMDDTFIVTRPSAVRVAEGHFSNSRPTGPWDVRVDLAGAGGVRATLPDMVRYLEGQLGMRDSPITPVLAQTQEQIADVGSQATSMAWQILSTENGRTFAVRPGGTGGFSSFFAFDRAAKHGVVLLSDTALTDVGGLRRLGLHLLDPSLPAGTPRNMATAEVKLIDALVGRYRLRTGTGPNPASHRSLELRRQGNKMTIQFDGEPEFEMEYDSAGEFYPFEFDAILQPRRKVEGTYTFTWHALGGSQQAERVGATVPVAARPAPAEAQLKEYEGNYSFSRTLGLRAYASGPKLMVQGTGQAPQEAAPFNKDIFVTERQSNCLDAQCARTGPAGRASLRGRRVARSIIAAGTVQVLRLTYQLRTNCLSVTTDRTTVALAHLVAFARWSISAVGRSGQPTARVGSRRVLCFKADLGEIGIALHTVPSSRWLDRDVPGDARRLPPVDACFGGTKPNDHK
jgi:D-alanyl-D-alanine-carboxypeptidase/D-alanyl-D-alanine-endopeptidase